MPYQPAEVSVLGGGQLGRMLVQAGLNLDVRFRVLDPDPAAPCRRVSQSFQTGSLTDYDTVMAFGRGVQLLTIEIENVNVRALTDLQAAGVTVYPPPNVLAIVQDKRVQKAFYRENGIPTADFVLTKDRADVARYADRLPAVHKLGREGYDGRGVRKISDQTALEDAFDAPGILEDLVPFEKEIAVIVARNPAGEVALFPAVEMVFHPEKNLVEYLFSPADLATEVAEQADLIAKQVAEALGVVGLLAVEMFVTPDGSVLVNEVAPRPHNSGHHTIEANYTSQYEQHLRAILGLPLGDTRAVTPAAMVNLLGEPGHTGPARYAGLPDALARSGVKVHLYGKQLTKPFRKMGHVTILDDNLDQLRRTAHWVQQTLRVET